MIVFFTSCTIYILCCCYFHVGKLNFVGRSGTALDVRYSAHDQGDMPENHTKELINLYGIINDDNEITSHGINSFLGGGFFTLGFW